MLATQSTPLKRLPTLTRLAGAALITLLCASPSLAGDPFRTTGQKPIGDRTETAFREFFEQGNYPKAKAALQTAEPDPLAFAMRAAVAYMESSSGTEQAKAASLAQFKANVDKTQEAAQGLLGTDSLRGNLYMGVYHFLNGAYILSRDGTVRGTPAALSESQKAFDYIDRADKKSPNDPEVSLIKGYTDLFVALNLPFSSPSQAIARLEKYAGPRYLADRGVALGYRELNQQAKALAAIDRAEQATPDNPEVLYLKAQILVRQGNYSGSLKYFDQALKKKAQLPPGVDKQIEREFNRAKSRAGR